MRSICRRDFLKSQVVLSAGLVMGAGAVAGAEARRKMTIDLVCGAIGVPASQREAVELAARHGFESVGADAGFLAKASGEQLAELKELMKAKGIVFGAAGLPMEFRQDEAKYEEGLRALPTAAAGLQRAGVTRVSTWLTPSSGQLTYRKNFELHARRLREAAKVLKDHGLRLGLEYVGPKTSWASRRFPFIHTLPEMQELVAEIGTGNVGYLLDSWHWWHAGDTVQDILALKASDVVAVDLNDAPTGIPKDEQQDGKRELPCATGVIPVKDFLQALNSIGYDGPVRAEPFNQALRSLPKDEAVAATAQAMKKAIALI